MTITQLNDIFMEMETLIQEFSETLISELARRDELEYEKELKNTFISLLLAVQNKRRQFHVEKKKNGKMQSSMTSSTQSLNGQNGAARPNGLSTSSMDPKYLTTVIPYHQDSGPPDNAALQVLIKSECLGLLGGLKARSYVKGTRSKWRIKKCRSLKIFELQKNMKSLKIQNVKNVEK